MTKLRYYPVKFTANYSLLICTMVSAPENRWRVYRGGGGTSNKNYGTRNEWLGFQFGNFMIEFAWVYTYPQKEAA